MSYQGNQSYESSAGEESNTLLSYPNFSNPTIPAKTGPKKPIKAPFGVATEDPLKAAFPNARPQPEVINKPFPNASRTDNSESGNFDLGLGGNINLSGQPGLVAPKYASQPFQGSQGGFSQVPPSNNTYGGNFNQPSGTGFNTVNPVTGEIDEPPLLEDLGIDLVAIKYKILCVLGMSKVDERFIKEADMSGPLLLVMAFGCFLMMSGKISFGYIYGFGIVGCLSVYGIMNLISQSNHLQLYHTISILGYCLLPIVALSGLNVIFVLKAGFGMLVAFLSVLWATFRATFFLETVLSLEKQKWLVAYPILLFYSTFVLITIFQSQNIQR